MDYFKESIKLHKKIKWKLETISKLPLETKDDLSLAYTPWVAEPCKEIAKDKEKAYDYTMKWNTIAVISDWTAVLGLWNIWPLASLPVMEWKCVLFKEFGWLNAFPIVLDTQDTEEIIHTIKMIAPGFWGINLEDIAAPRCFEIEERLIKELDIPIFHDDQHGTAIVALAWLINALKIVKKKKEDVHVVVNGAWAAWVAITKLLLKYWIKHIVMVDSAWTIYKWREKLNPTKEMLSNITNTACVLDPGSKACKRWGLEDAIKWTDVFLWVSRAWVLSQDMIRSMAPDPIIIAMANPIPEIMPDEAIEAWAKIVATWRSDFPNQVNNVLVFPWLFSWMLKYRKTKFTDKIKLNAAIALANCVKKPSVDCIIPSPLDKSVAKEIEKSVKNS